MRRLIPSVLLSAVVLSACQDESIVEPTLDGAAPPVAASVTGSSSDGVTVNGFAASPVPRHIVSFQGRLSPGTVREIESRGGTVVFSHKIGFAIVDGLSDEAAGALTAAGEVVSVEPDVTIQRGPVDAGLAPLDMADVGLRRDGGIELDDGAGGQVRGLDLDAPGDAFFYGLGLQWHMDAIGAPAAWNAGRTGSPGVTVAIIDSGLDDTHADLVGRVDASRSRSFLPEGELDYLIGAILFPGFPDYADFNSHGTHVGATVASNGIVGAGVTDQVTLMGIKVCRWNNSCSGAAIIAGLLYAADNGAEVANMSLGGTFDKSDIARAGFGGYLGFLNETFNYATRQGMTIVVSAGNAATDLDHDGDLYKTYCTTAATVCVSATGPQDTDNILFGPFYDIKAPASYTNYGRSAIDVAAPGGDSNGFVWAACSSSRVQVSGGFIVPSNCTQSKTFITAKAGTSMAAPHVTGLAALLVEDYGRNPGRIRTLLQQGTEDLGPSGADAFYGKGYINVPAALGLE